jgi:phosphoribosylglycinamide formyltransferase-1
MTLYRARTGSKADEWVLYTVASAERPPVRVAVLVSGGGTNLQALIDAEAAAREAGGAIYEIALVVADREGTYAIERARKAGIPAELALPPKGVPRPEARRAVSDRVLELARDQGVEAIVLAGFLTIMSGPIIEEFSGRILNIHPALLPKFGGPGMWGHHVHEAVLASGDSESGCTVHIADSGCDTGPILLQRRVPVLPGDTPDSLAGRIHAEEHLAIVEGTKLLAARLRA